MARNIVKTLRHPVSGIVYKFPIGSREEYETYKRYKQDWQPRTAKREAAIRNRPLEESSEAAALNPAGLTSGEQLRLAAPSIAATVAGGALGGPWMQGVRYAPMMRIAAAGGAGAAAAPIAGTDPVGEAKTQAIVQGAGEMLGGGMAMAGRGLQRKVFNTDPALNESFGDIGGAASRERIGVSNPRTISEGPEPAGLGEKLLGNMRPLTGSRAAGWELERLRPRIEMTLAKDATEHNVAQVTEEVRRRLWKKLGRRPQRAEILNEVDGVIKGIRDENPLTWDNLSAWEKKRGAQEVSVDLLQKRARPAVGNAAADMKADAEQLVNAELQAVLNERLAKIPGYTPLNNRYRELTGVQRAARAAEVGRDATASPRAVAGGGAPRVAFNPLEWLSPQQMSGIGRTLEHPVTQPAMQNVPRLLLELLRREQPWATPLGFMEQRKAEQAMREQNP